MSQESHYASDNSSAASASPSASAAPSGSASAFAHDVLTDLAAARERIDEARLTCAMRDAERATRTDDHSGERTAHTHTENAARRFHSAVLAAARRDAIARIKNGFDDDTLFRISYVPSVIVNVVWDYADTICNQAAAMRISETKQLTRTIRQMQREYEKSRQYGTQRRFREQEDTHTIELQDEWFKDYFKELYRDLSEHISYCFPKLNADNVEFVVSVYMCIVVLKALSKYVKWADAEIERVVGKTKRSIMPQNMVILNSLVIEYAGNCKAAISDADLQPMADRLYQNIRSIEFTLTNVDSMDELPPRATITATTTDATTTASDAQPATASDATATNSK
jgi:hypothetical protein